MGIVNFVEIYLKWHSEAVNIEKNAYPFSCKYLSNMYPLM